MTDARKNRILIADDEPFNRELLEAFLSEGNYELEYAADGQETLDKTASFKPDLVLLDVMMPKLSGFEVCEKLKKGPETSSVMVLMVTALNDLGDVERAVAVGCDDFLSKPINQIELLIRVENLLKLRTVTSELERLRQYVDSMEDAFAPKKKA